MKQAAILTCLFLYMAIMLAQGDTAAVAANPIEKVLEMLSGLQAKVIADGKASQSMYDEYAEWCEDTAKDLAFEIKTAKSQIADLRATISEADASIAECTTKIEDLSGSIATNEADLKGATAIRAKEAKTFATEEKELVEMVDMLQRAVAILEREMNKGASMLQLQSAKSVEQALAIMVQASAFSSADSSRLTALIQSSEEEDSDSDQELEAPAAAAYEGHSTGIVETMEALLEKAEAQLANARKAEATALHNHEMLAQSLSDEIRYAQEDMGKAKKCVSEGTEAKATAEGDLDVTLKDLAEDMKSKSDLHHECMTKATEFEEETKSRGEELDALAAAKKAISDTTGGAASQAYDLEQTSLLQVSQRTRRPLSPTESQAVKTIRDLARKIRDPVLTQLASRMSSAFRMGAALGDDPFGKVKGLIMDLIERLEKEAQAEAGHKAYCDKELGETNEKKTDKEAELEKLGTKLDQAKARTAQLKQEIAAVQKELSELASMQAEMDKLREEEKALFAKNKPEMEMGIDGVKLALKVLNEYYAKGDDKSHESSDGAGASIIGMLEVIESDFMKLLNELTAAEEASAAEYDKQTKENEVARTTKEQDVKYKTKEVTGLEKAISELSSDIDGLHEELDAVYEYLAKIKEMCIAKPEPYEERKRRREQEIEGLKAALEILEGEMVLLQSSSKHMLRGNRV